MGKDHEFLEAARSGNISVVEKILNQKSKRSGPLASLRRGPGANVQDNSGYSALHHASLNGHADVVRLLLAHDASPNLPDVRGSSPLHLAAWAGHQDIVKLFLTHPHRPANPNLQTIENETPLHCAAQHGHTGALTTLLAHGANPNVTNNRNETPLDLASQYGRLQAVQMLIRAHPELLTPFKAQINNTPQSSTAPIKHRIIVSHSPLHLASRNGHKNVVEVLLAAGVNVNLLTPSGTALHEAALCGKDSVVRTLLDSGADLDATDSEGRTALDILEEFPPHVTKGIVSVINNHRNSMNYDSESDDVRENHLHKNHVTPMSLGSSYENNRASPVYNYCNSHHDIASPSSSMGSLGPPSPRQRASSGDISEHYLTMEPSKHKKPAAPKKPPRRNLSVSPTHLLSRNNIMSMSTDSKLSTSQALNYEYIFLAHTGQTRQQSIASDQQYVQMGPPRPEPRKIIINPYENTALKSYNPNRKLRRNKDHYEQFSIEKHKITDNIITVQSANNPQSPTNYQQPPTPEHPPPSAMQAERHIHDRIRPLSQEYKRRSGIQQNLMMESGTSPSEPLCPSLCASSGSLSSSVSISDRSVSTDCVEEYIGDVPFAGLFKGSTMTLNNANASSFPRPNTQQNDSKSYSVKQQERPKTLCPQHYDPRDKYQKNRSMSFGGMLSADVPSLSDDCRNRYSDNDENGVHKVTKAKGIGNDVLSPFDEQEAWAKISEIMESFGSGILSTNDITDHTKMRRRESGASLTSINKGSLISQFLHEHNLEHIESILVDNGFDHIKHLNGILDETDFKALNISSSEGKKLLEAIKELPVTVSLPALQNNNNNNSMLKVDQWLQSIHLTEYIDIFKRHLYTNLEGVCRVWEVELQTVLEINKLGHRKRILYSISNKRSPAIISLHELSDDINSLETNIMELRDGVVEKLPSHPSSGTETSAIGIRHNNKKNRPAPKPPVRMSSLEIRAPSELLLGLPSNLRTQWRHPANTLITNSVTYDVYYLGSTVVKELRGTESTRKSIQKLKREDRTILPSTNPSLLQNQSHQPVRKQLVRLSISHRGVEFIHTESQDTICEHEIRNINCACQDADDLSHFAYITKDADVNIHYCHVFNADSMDLATEIILTLGQAFEVAYQLALRESSSNTIK